MTAAAISQRTNELLLRFNLTTAAAELARRLEQAGQPEVLGLVLEVLEMEAEAREQRKIARLRRASQLPPGKTFDTLDLQRSPTGAGSQAARIGRAATFSKAPSTCWPSARPGWVRVTAACSARSRADRRQATQYCSVPPINWCRNCSPPSAI